MWKWTFGFLGKGSLYSISGFVVLGEKSYTTLPLCDEKTQKFISQMETKQIQWVGKDATNIKLFKMEP